MFSTAEPVIILCMRRWGSYISTTAPVKYSNVKPVTFPVHELGSNHPNGHGTANVRNHDRGESVLSPQVLSRDVVWLPQVCHHISRFLSRHYRFLFHTIGLFFHMIGLFCGKFCHINRYSLTLTHTSASPSRPTDACGIIGSYSWPKSCWIWWIPLEL